jgi:hypothetical protein
MTTCPCGIEYTAEQFDELEQIGTMKLPEPPHLRMANCPCASTISVWVDDDGERTDPPAD